MKRFALLLLLLVGCQDSPSVNKDYHLISGRDLAEPRYRVVADRAWRRIDPVSDSSLQDTKTPICEYFIDDPEGTIRIALHTFPMRIPKEAMVKRWQEQLPTHNLTRESITPLTQAGFVGLRYENDGLIAFLLQLSPDHHQTLSSPFLPKRYEKMRSDVTIKAEGPQKLLENHRASIIAFATSFEMCQEIPRTP